MRGVVSHPSGRLVRCIGLTILALCVTSGVARGTHHEVIVVDFGQEPDRVPRGWEITEKEGKADFALVEDGEGGGRVLRLRSRSSSFALQTEHDVDLGSTPILEWQWKVTALPEGGDFRANARDDQAAQLYILFSPDVLRTEVIAYVWDTTAPQETTGEPTFPPVYPVLRIRTVVVESGAANMGKWMTVRRNVVEDYRKLFGGEVDRISGFRIQINTQHTKSHAESYWRYVKIKAQP